MQLHFDFAALLLILTALTGVIWLIDSLFFAASRGDKPEPLVTEYAKSFFPVILIVLLIRSFIAEPFKIPSGSMIPTLLVGDFILVNKYAYGVRLPVFNTKILGVGEPKTGDVVVFRFPNDESLDYIKRMVGVPGDEIVYRNKILYINGEPMAQVDKGLYVGQGSSSRHTSNQLREEDLAGVKHEILINRSANFAGEMRFNVPTGHYFVMGDNRDNSNDSRYWKFVPEENLVGRAFFIWFNWDGGPDWSRIGHSIE